MTEIALAMPQITCNHNVKSEVAFTVINQDNLPLNMTIAGETILKPFGVDNHKLKPNVIVHPTRRIPVNFENNKEQEQNVSSTLETQQQQALIDENNGRNRRSKFRNRNNSRVKIKIEELKNQIGSNFSKVLDFKLRNLQRCDKKQTQKDSIGNNISKKPFVTTVKKGLFLEPPPEVATLIGIKVDEQTFKKDPKETKKLYAFASQPRVLNRSSPKNLHYARCEAAAIAAGKIVESIISSNNDILGSQPNLAGKNKFKNINNNLYVTHSVQPLEQGNRGSASARAREARRRALARKRATNQSKPDASVRKRRNVEGVEFQEMSTQTDTSIPVPTLRGEDIGTQINPGDLFNSDVAVQPILEVLVGKTIEQALIEVLEEEELVALGEQQRRYLESRVTERVHPDNNTEILKRKDKNELEEIKESELNSEDDKRSSAFRIQDTVASQLPSILESLENDKINRIEGFKMDSDESFLPWLMKEIMLEVQDIVSSRDVLTDIVKEILENREEIDRIIRKRSSGDTDEDLMENMPRRNELRIRH